MPFVGIDGQAGGLFPAWTVVVGFWLGATIGSFLNVVIYRMPRGISLSNPPHSFCPNCKHQLGAVDLIPILSWLFLGGKCHYCHQRVSPRYMVVELINAVMWAGVWWEFFVVGNAPAQAIAYALGGSALLCVILIDAAYFIIPDQVNAFLLVVGLVFNGVLIAQHSPLAFTWGIPSALAGWILGVGALWGVAFLGRILFGKDAMGHGDIKLARGIGAILFPLSAGISFGLAIVLGAVLGALQVVLRSVLTKKQTAASSEREIEEDEEEYVPESIPSLLKCGVGYLFALDVVGLFAPKFYMSYFGEDPFEPMVGDEESTDPTELTMIPFGPYLALGAIFSIIFSARLHDFVFGYLKWATGGPK